MNRLYTAVKRLRFMASHKMKFTSQCDIGRALKIILPSGFCSLPLLALTRILLPRGGVSNSNNYESGTLEHLGSTMLSKILKQSFLLSANNPIDFISDELNTCAGKIKGWNRLSDFLPSLQFTIHFVSVSSLNNWKQEVFRTKPRLST